MSDDPVDKPDDQPDDNQPSLREPAPPFGLPADSWRKFRLIGFSIFCLLLTVLMFRLITRPRHEPIEPHALDGQRLPDYYEVVETLEGCESLEVVPTVTPFFAMHPGHPRIGPVFRPCRSPSECTAVREDPSTEAAVPSIPITDGEQSERPEWSNWLAVPTVLENDPNGGRSGVLQRQWAQDQVCHEIERQAELRRVAQIFELETRISYGYGPCPEFGSSRCVARRVVRLRPLRR